MELQRLVEYMLGSIEAVLVAPGGPTPYIHTHNVSFNVLPSVKKNFNHTVCDVSLLDQSD